MEKHLIVFCSQNFGGEDKTLITRTKKKIACQKWNFLSHCCWVSRLRCLKSSVTRSPSFFFFLLTIVVIIGYCRLIKRTLHGHLKKQFLLHRRRYFIRLVLFIFDWIKYKSQVPRSLVSFLFSPVFSFLLRVALVQINNAFSTFHQDFTRRSSKIVLGENAIQNPN